MKCANCGREYRPIRHDQLYCSDHCRQKGRNLVRSAKTLECLECGKEYPTTAELTQYRVCSMECFDKREEQFRECRKDKKFPPKRIKKCIYCGDDFMATYRGAKSCVKCRKKCFQSSHITIQKSQRPWHLFVAGTERVSGYALTPIPEEKTIIPWYGNPDYSPLETYSTTRVR